MSPYNGLVIHDIFTDARWVGQRDCKFAGGHVMSYKLQGLRLYMKCHEGFEKGFNLLKSIIYERVTTFTRSMKDRA